MKLHRDGAQGWTKRFLLVFFGETISRFWYAVVALLMVSLQLCFGYLNCRCWRPQMDFQRFFRRHATSIRKELRSQAMAQGDAERARMRVMKTQDGQNLTRWKEGFLQWNQALCGLVPLKVDP